MRRLLLLLALAPLAAPPAPAEAAWMAPHPSILVVGDAGFGIPGSGVRGGSGTAEDPYVMAGWTVAPTRGFGILLRDTRAHVRIEEVVVGPVAAPWFAECAAALPESCPAPGPRAIGLRNASNVTLARIAVPLPPLHALHLDGAFDIRVENMTVGKEGRHLPDGSIRTALEIRRSARVVSSDFTAWHLRYPVWAGWSEEIRVEGARFSGLREAGVPEASFVKLGSVRGFLLAASDLREVEILVVGEVDDLQVRESRMTGGRFGLWNDGAPLRRPVLCGTALSGFREAAAQLHGTVDATISGNEVRDSFVGLSLNGTGALDLSANRIGGTWGWFGLGLSHPGARVHGNDLSGNAGGVSVVRPANLTGNWWGPDGPDGVLRATAPVEVAPWAAAPPALVRACPEAGR